MSQGQARNLSLVKTPTITTGSGAPISTPGKAGDIYVDTTNGTMYMAMGTAGSFNWGAIGQGSFNSFTASTVPGIINWYKADGSLTYDGGGAVSQWNDASGNNDNLIQSTTINKPTWMASQINGLPAVYFGGVNSYIGKASGCVISTGIPATTFIVAKTPNSASDQCIFGTADNGYVGLGRVSDGKLDYFQYNNLNNTPSVPTTSAYYLITCSNTGIANTGWMETNAGADRVLINNASGYGMFTSAITRGIGAYNGGVTTLPFNGYVAEIIGYNGNLSVANIAIVKTYLNNKYAIY